MTERIAAGEPFAATLSPRDRRLASRLEGFGDIVFRFAVSQCALQLPMTAHGVDLTQRRRSSIIS